MTEDYPNLRALSQGCISRKLNDWTHLRPEASVVLAEVDRFRRDYGLFEEMAPPDMPRKEFVSWCLDAWERSCGGSGWPGPGDRQSCGHSGDFIAQDGEGTAHCVYCRCLAAEWGLAWAVGDE